MEAIVLAAGFGSRLQSHGPSKPLVTVAGRALLAHVLERLAAARIDEVVIVVGHRAAEVVAAVRDWKLAIRVRTIEVDDPALPNGVSALAAAPFVSGRCLLVMSDHLVDPTLYRRIASAQAADGELLLGVDRRLDDDWVDLDDVTRVLTEGDRIVAIGKGLERYNGFDTGVFSVDHGLFEALAGLEEPSLSAGVAALAARGLARAVETGDCAWLDVDDPRAHAIAEKWLETKA